MKNKGQNEEKQGLSRRNFLQISGTATAGVAALPLLGSTIGPNQQEKVFEIPKAVEIVLTVNGKKERLEIDPRASVLDTLRYRLNLTGTKKGCDAGHCGACTVHINGERKLSCLTLAMRHQNDEITTIEGLSDGDQLHPLQEAFIEHDAFQCGYCTSGQIMSGVACINEGHAKDTEEIREYMSGNICRCGAYPNIIKAVETTAKKM
ncbi:2Fe-2S iron-sulfur cluster binding domain-containing protein [Aquimarina sp. U1-2]|uniref:(2Fe-2S)-binding protein n=1 Tax=Aquimarina sp. U1-2 TaxID=2823141 RepID=UPI001AECA53C|nr:2Fe-2S iron-sulfur cluster-binding protein [Aquimarina sp. U1-2]MBP2831232.1 2Fe-2S iron-sulfur cluster binding domain-containing protein [Aquimarina sp. U1-2]